MTPIALFDAITADATLNALGITADTVFESQSLRGDERPHAQGLFVVIDVLEPTFDAVLRRGSRTVDVAVHVADDITRSYATIDSILNAVDSALLPLEHVTGTDNVRVTCVRRVGRSGNLVDPGWHAIFRHAAHSVLAAPEPL